ncbi:hypothetical protein [Mycobacterium phage Y10]|uniref:DUF4352 domain-containing protein n=2 Tax=Fionnbharthvirus TaxID=2948708 RepID=A0A2Z5XAN2_9CAUD|nr:queuine tRNA-ribosyltransferase [Mycobacterium phage Henu3]QJD52339.1 hypothetical protein PBI_JF1_44 [Mycobacterium phage JF1]BBC43331.1 hypothetical protein [Mycobacterium phage Y10]BBC43422.1 hypothetical protein [Mycobacterium phage Y2]QAU04993.1 queuine tRNA-ribosyltransferase [Mycobacterium phage Henu3]BBC43513.1 hypothetical protein [Mycobacterium phage Y10]
MKSLTALSAAVAAMAAIGLSACAPSTTAGSEPTEAAAAAGSDTAAPAGSSVRDGKFEFTVVSVERAKSVTDPTGNQFTTVDAQGEFIVVTLTVKNIGDEARSFSGTNQKLLDRAGREYDANSEADMWMNPGTGDINPGNQIEVRVAFDVPPGTQPAELALHDSMFSGGARLAI